VWIHGMHIAPYPFSRDNPDPDRRRKLLLHRREVAEIRAQVEQQGLTVVPLRIYFKDGLAKVEIALAKGKHTYDKRHALAERDAKRDLERAVRSRARSGDD
jgi:SsrA-binding protein